MRRAVPLASAVWSGLGWSSLGAMTCGGEPPPAQTASTTSTSDAAPPTTGESSSNAPGTSGGADSGTTIGPPDGGTSTGEAPDAESSTGGAMLCGLTEDPDEPGPWFRLYNGATLVEDGATLELECGGQGSWMFYLATEQGGFMPPGSAAYFAITLDVPGFDGLSPDGHFFEAHEYGVNLGCSGSGLPGIAVLLPDALTDPGVLDGVPATLHAELLVPSGAPVVLDAAITLGVDPALGAEGCGHG